MPGMDEVDELVAGAEVGGMTRYMIDAVIRGEGIAGAARGMIGAPSNHVAATALGLAGMIGGLIALGKITDADLIEARDWVVPRRGS